LLACCARGGVLVAEPVDGDRLGRKDGVGGVPKLCAPGSRVSPLMLSLSSDKVGLLSGGGLVVLSPTLSPPPPLLFALWPPPHPFAQPLCVEPNKLRGDEFIDEEVLLGEMSQARAFLRERRSFSKSRNSRSLAALNFEISSSNSFLFRSRMSIISASESLVFVLSGDGRAFLDI
jgi:hypothetical protein